NIRRRGVTFGNQVLQKCFASRCAPGAGDDIHTPLAFLCDGTAAIGDEGYPSVSATGDSVDAAPRALVSLRLAIAERSTGRVKRKMLPLPSWLSTQMCPPCCSTMAR